MLLWGVDCDEMTSGIFLSIYIESVVILAAAKKCRHAVRNIYIGINTKLPLFIHNFPM